MTTIKLSLNGSVRINAVDTVRYTEEQYKSIDFAGPNNNPETSMMRTVGTGSRSTKREQLTTINAGRDFLMGKWILEGAFHIYALQSERMRTTSLGLVQGNLREILDAIASNQRFLTLEVPTIGAVTFEMPSVKIDGKWIVQANAPWLTMKQTGIGSGRLIETDTNRNFPATTMFYHNALNSLAAGDLVKVQTTFFVNQNTGEINREVHDHALAAYTLLTNEDLDPQNYLREQRQTAVEYREVKKDKFFGQVQEAVLAAGTATVQDATIVVIIAGVEMNPLAVPAGRYLFANEKGQPISKAAYSVSTDRDRRGLVRRGGELIHLIAIG